MKPDNFKKVIWWTEVCIVALIAAGVKIALDHNALMENIALIIVQIMLYFVLSIIFFMALNPDVLFSESDTQIRMKKVEITDDEVISYMKKAVTYLSLSKLFILSAFTVIPFCNLVLESNSFWLMIFCLMLMVYFAYLFMKNLSLAKGYLPENLKDIILNLIFYYNPEDQRAVVDKPMGIGSTINLATRQGKIILLTMMAIPVTITLILLVIFLLSVTL